MTMKSKLLCVVLATGLGGACLSAMAQQRPVAAAVVQEVKLEIPAQPVEYALAAFAEQSGTQIVFYTDVADGLRSAPLSGSYTPRAALDRLLEGTGLRYEFVSEGRVVTIQPARTTQAGSEGSQSGEVRLAQMEEDRRESEASEANKAVGNPNAEDSATNVEETKLDEIVVTAQKRVERLQDVPVPVTAISAQSLVNSNQVRLQEYYNHIPSLSVTTGTFHALQVTIRGLTTGGGNPTVGVVIDDVPFGSSRGTSFGLEVPDLDPSSLQRVEVLRGPQGTLYGASSMGGLLKFVTVPPDVSQFRGMFQVGASGVRNSSHAGYNVRGAVNIPVNETLAVRASAFTRQDPGFINNPLLGLDGINEAIFSGGRLSALWQISPRLTFNLSGLIQRSNVDGTSEVHARPGLQDLEQDTIRGSGAYDKTLQAYSATISAKLGRVALTSLSGYNISRFDDVVDFSVASRRDAVVRDEYRTEKFSQELRASVPLFARSEWLFGAFYTEEKSDTATQRILLADRATGAFGTTTFGSNAPQRFEELALFTNLTVGFTDALDVQFGVRQGNNDQRYRSVNVLTGVAAPRIETEDDSLTYLITPRLKLTADVMLYARLASGYRAGGPNTNSALLGLPNQSYAPDKTKNYEIGAKATLMNGMLGFDASLYRIDWEDMQIQILSGGFTFFTNGSAARSQGAELSWELRPYDGLTVSGWAAGGTAELSEPFPSTATVFGPKDGRLPYGSEFSGSLSLDQSIPIKTGIAGSVGVSINYVGERLGAFRGLVAGVPLPRQVLPSYTKIDLHAGLEAGEWSADFFLNNLTDRRGLLQGGLGQTDPTSFYYIQPRTYGFSVTRSF
jgi:iron complex outermembrane recepter protein